MREVLRGEVVPRSAGGSVGAAGCCGDGAGTAAGGSGRRWPNCCAEVSVPAECLTAQPHQCLICTTSSESKTAFELGNKAY